MMIGWVGLVARILKTENEVVFLLNEVGAHDIR
jgi:hypothetical protein